MEPVFIHMVRGFDRCNFVINRAIDISKEAFDCILAMVFFNHWRRLRCWLTELCGRRINRFGNVRAIISQIILLIIIFLSTFWQQHFLPNIFIGAVINPLVKSFFLRSIKGQATTNQLFAPDQAQNTGMCT